MGSTYGVGGQHLRPECCTVPVVQITATGVNVLVSFIRLGRDGGVLSKDEGVFLTVLRDGAWKIQARSTFGS